MKPFTFLMVALGLVLGFRFAASRAQVAPDRVRPGERVFVSTSFAPDADEADDRDRDRDRDRARDDREEAEGLPVPIVPGTRVTEAEIQPPRQKARRKEPPRRVVVLDAPSTIRPIAGQLSATEDRARADARHRLEHAVTEWLTPEAPTTWKPPVHLVASMIRRTDVRPVEKPYGTLYVATLQADFAPECRNRLLTVHQRELVRHRLMLLGGSLGFLLACLAGLAGYIRADEATRGYYTHWLRALAAAGVGGSGVLIYQILM
jgi:hypothetical protein